MNLTHLHLHVHDVARARRFYEEYFGLRVHVWHGEILFMRDAAGFDLALAPSAAVPPLPDWLHFGFRLADAESVRALYRRLVAAAVPVVHALVDESDFVSFRCADPDGYTIEVYWE